MTLRRSAPWTFLLALCGVVPGFAQDPADIRELKLRDWRPIRCSRATRLPVVDVHNHLGGGKAAHAERPARYLEEMDEAGVRTVVNLDGGWGDRLEETLSASTGPTRAGS